MPLHQNLWDNMLIRKSVKMKKYKVAVVGLGMGINYANAVMAMPNAELCLVYDPFYNENPAINHSLYEKSGDVIAKTEEEVYNSDADIVVIASPDHFHAEQSVKALRAGKHVICEKPLAPTVAECRKIVETVKETGKCFMTGQICRYAPGFKLAKQILDSGRIGRLVCIESEYAHDYSIHSGWNNRRKDPKIARQNFLGGGCHALDLTRWLAGNPLEVFAINNHIYKPDWPTPDTWETVVKFPNEVIGRIFVSIGVKRPYTMRTVISGTKGTIICDNKSPSIQISEEAIYDTAEELAFSTIPVAIKAHNVRDELETFIHSLETDKKSHTNEYEGMYTVAFAEAAMLSAQTQKPEKVIIDK